MVKMVMIVYNEVMDGDIMSALEDAGLKNYTKLAGIFGKGASSGTHLGDDIWPGKNNILFVSSPEANVKNLVSSIKALRLKMGQEGVKAFVLPVEDVTE
jgi:hypothetical protein